MTIKALIGAAALSALVAAGAGVAYAQDAGQAPGAMAPIPNPPEAPKAAHHHAKHMKKHAAKHHMAAKSSKGDAKPKTDAK